MSRSYRNPQLHPDRATDLKKLFATISINELVALVRAQHKMIQGSDRGGLFRRLANTIEVLARSVRLTKVQVALLHKLVEEHGVEEVIGFLHQEDAIRHSVQDILQQVVNPNEGAEKYHEHYNLALKSLDAFGIDHKDAPRWEDIAARLTPEKLALIAKLPEAKLILVPPQSRQDLVKALNNKVGTHGMKYEAFMHRLEDDQLWNNGQPENLTWEVAFVDGRQDVPYNETLQSGKTAHEQVKALRALHEKDGIGTLVGARSYLTLMMQGLVAKKPTDEKYWTVLNAEVVAKDEKALLGFGNWDFVRVSLGSVGPFDLYNVLRLRGAVRV